jgi:arylsulfatase A-like enzyme
MDMIRAKGMDKTILAQRKTRARNGPFDPDRLLLEPDDDVDCFIGIQARQMMQDLPTDRPWALIVAFTGPGNDLPPPTIYDQMVEPSMLEDGFVPTDFTKVNALAELDYPRVSLQRLDRQRLARVRADYLGRVSLMDYVIGRIEEQAKERSDFDRTWMVTGSDRGYLMGEHGLLGHRSFLSGAIEVPIMVTPPTPVKTEMAEGLVSTVDLAATIAEIGGCDVPAAIAGRSLLAALRDEPVRTLTGGCCVSEFGRRLMLETERFKVIFDSVTNEVLGLYDLLNDPDERTNMTTDAAGRNLLDSLRWRLGDALMPLRALPVSG